MDVLSTRFAHIPESRQPDRVASSLHDTLMSGVAMRCFQHPRLLAVQRKMQQRRSRCHLETRFAVHEGPSDTQRRESLAGGPVELWRPALPERLAKGRRGGWAPDCKSPGPSGYQQGASYSAMRAGSASFHSPRGQCPGCVQRTDGTGQGHDPHTGVSAPLGKAGSPRGMPWEVAEVRHSDGQENQDGALKAAQRLRSRGRQEPPHCH